LNVNVNLELRQPHAQLHMHHTLTRYIIIVTICKPSRSSAITERPRDARVTSIRKIAKWIFEPPFWGLRGNVDASCVRRWKQRGRLPIGDNWTF